MIIKNARFLVSNQSVLKCPQPNKPEFAFIGRSNVGKSSLINMLCQSGSLAKTSSTPGKTQLINHFIINESWYLVDLPGYGYAKLSKAKRLEFGKMINDYLEKRENLMCLFILIDSRHEPQALDLEFINKMGMAGFPFALIFTKTDKLTTSQFTKNIEVYKQRLLKDWEELPPLFTSSAIKKDGREAILDYIQSIIDQWVPPLQSGKKTVT